MGRLIRATGIGIVLLALSGGAPAAPQGGDAAFRSAWPAGVERIWAGPEYWANRLQDWKIRDGRLECLAAAADRSVHILTRRLSPRNAEFSLRVRTGVAATSRAGRGRNWVGFRVGAKGELDDFRDDAIFGKGLNVGVSTDGDLFIGDYELLQQDQARNALRDLLKQGLELRLSCRPEGGTATLILAALDPARGTSLSSVEQAGIDPAGLAGNLALVSHLPDLDAAENGTASWFAGWEIGGAKVEIHDDSAFGPILFAPYTLGRGVLKMTAQLPPVGGSDGQSVKLQVQKESGDWMDVAEAPLDPDARTATFRSPGWDSTRDVPYRLVYELAVGEKSKASFTYAGTVRKEPLGRDDFVLAGFNGGDDAGFPRKDLVEHVRAHNPDLLFFSGDQVTERAAGFGVQYEPVDAAILDYLRKWYLFGWAFGGLLRDCPAVIVPADHDVYQSRLWGAGGQPAGPGFGIEAQDAGGYKMPARWVNMVQRTQTSHLPDPFDPAPAEQGIGVYFGELQYAGLSFAVLEDRKFKSAPKPLLPKALVRNGWAADPDFKPEKDSDAPGAELLGERQTKFLRSWAADWTGGTRMKTVLSQSLFAGLLTLPKGAPNDDVLAKLPLTKAGDSPPDDLPAADMDSGGWPSAARNAAIREMRKAFALHISGGRNLGAAIQYGVEAWRDSGYAFGLPSISNLLARRWFPRAPGAERKAGAPNFSGDFKDAFGNRMTVAAAANPVEPYGRATGYGIVRFDKETRVIVLECWPRDLDPKAAGAAPYPGWPVKISQFDNYSRAAKAFLPTLLIKGMRDPVVQVIEERSGEILYTLRIKGVTFRPKVFAPGVYSIRVGEPGTEKWQTLRRVQSLPADGFGQRTVEFQ